MPRLPARRSRSFLSSLILLAGFAVGLSCGPAAAQVVFTDVTTQQFPDGLARSHYLWGDCDGDGDEDLLVGGKNVYINSGPPDFVFTKLADTGDLGSGPHSRAVWIDIDNDGDLDLFGIGGGTNERLYRNDGDCRFTDISDFDGDGTFDDMGDGAPSMTTSTGDYDGDGLLDLYVGNYERHCDSTICGDCMTDRLWRNRGDGTFEDVSVSSGIHDQELALAGTCLGSGGTCTTDADCPAYPAGSCKSGLCARGSNWVDYDNDGDIDIFVANYRLDENLLWENQGDGSFTNVARERNVDGEESDGDRGHVLGADWGDFDNDGDMDLYTANLAHNWGYLGLGHDISQLLENGGPPGFTFTDIRSTSGMRPFDTSVQSDWAETSPAWADWDNDGLLDIYVTHIYDSSAENYSDIYVGHGDGTFTRVTDDHPALKLYKNYSAAWCDFDQDGDLDLVTYGAPSATGTGEAHLFRNDGGNANRWIHVRLRGAAGIKDPGTNRFGVGARVTLVDGGVTQIREVQGGHGYHTAMNSAPVEFGLGPGEIGPAGELRVRWTGGATDTFSGVPMNRRLIVFEKGVTVRRGTDPSAQLPVLDPDVRLFPFRDVAAGAIIYYRVDDPRADLEPLLLRKVGGDEVELFFR